MTHMRCWQNRQQCRVLGHTCPASQNIELACGLGHSHSSSYTYGASEAKDPDTEFAVCTADCAATVAPEMQFKTYIYWDGTAGTTKRLIMKLSN